MQEVDLQRLVLPALLALLILGAFTILATSGGSSEPASPLSPALTPSSSKATSTKPTIRFVKVKQGDTPTSIAAKARIPVARLLELNPSIDPSQLRPGQTLKLPQ